MRRWSGQRTNRKFCLLFSFAFFFCRMERNRGAGARTCCSMFCVLVFCVLVLLLRLRVYLLLIRKKSKQQKERKKIETVWNIIVNICSSCCTSQFDWNSICSHFGLLRRCSDCIFASQNWAPKKLSKFSHIDFWFPNEHEQRTVLTATTKKKALRRKPNGKLYTSKQGTSTCVNRTQQRKFCGEQRRN